MSDDNWRRAALADLRARIALDSSGALVALQAPLERIVEQSNTLSGEVPLPDTGVEGRDFVRAVLLETIQLGIRMTIGGEFSPEAETLNTQLELGERLWQIEVLPDESPAGLLRIQMEIPPDTDNLIDHSAWTAYESENPERRGLRMVMAAIDPQVVDQALEAISQVLSVGGWAFEDFDRRYERIPYVGFRVTDQVPPSLQGEDGD